MLDEVANAGRENLDAEHAWHYDAKEDADALGELRILEDLGLDGQSALVDLGAGTGQLAMAAAAVCARVVAVDVSPVMVQPLKAKIDEAAVSNVEVVQAGFLTYEHRGRPADFVYSRFALHHLPDFWKAVALDRARRILQPGGILRLWDVVYDFGVHEAEDRIAAWCDAYTDAPEGEWGRVDLEEHVRDEHSTFSWVLEPMIERCGFEIEEAQYTSDGFFGKYIARAR
ncbi:MAG: methyltransferase domain-containing protein [Egibacteraceae bacterium]